MPITEAKSRANKKYDKAHYDLLTTSVKKESGLKGRVDAFCTKTGKSKNAMIAEAITEYLDRYEITNHDTST